MASSRRTGIKLIELLVVVLVLALLASVLLPTLKADNLAAPKATDTSTAETQPATQPAARRIAELFLAAVRDKNIEKIKALSLGSVTGWLDWTPVHNSSRARRIPGIYLPSLEKGLREIREKVYADRPELITQIQEMAVRGDWAAVRLTIPNTKSEKYLIVVFRNSPQGWRFVCWADAKGPLEENLAKYSQRLAEIIAATEASGLLTTNPATQPREMSEAAYCTGALLAVNSPNFKALSREAARKEIEKRNQSVALFILSDEVLNKAAKDMYEERFGPNHRIIQDEARRFRDVVEVSPLPETNIIRIAVFGSDRQKIARIANAIAEAAVKQYKGQPGSLTIQARAVPPTPPTSRPTSKPTTQPATQPATAPAGDPRRGAAVTLELDKNQYYLGENVLLHWRIRNAGDEPFKFSIGGDGRTPGAKRAIRFKVEAVDEQGRQMDDPYPNPVNMGGWFSEMMLETGKDVWEPLQLMRYREFPKPGKYTIKVYHDLGWEDRAGPPFPAGTDSSDIPKGPRLAPVVTTTVRLVMPDEQQARQVVDAMLAMPPDAGRTWGQRGKPFADFELLRYPVYLPIMKELAQNGDARGLDAIGAMAFSEATAALLELTGHKDPTIAAKAGDMLLWRTPYIYDTAPSRRNYLVERSWTDELKKAALVPTWNLLDGNDRAGIIRGARLVQSLGGKDDLPALIKVMDRVLPAFKVDPTEQEAYLRPATASGALVDAAGELIGRGAQPPISAATPGQAAAFLIGLGLKGDFRPEGWRDRAVGLINHRIPFLRDLALRNMPLPLDDAAIAVVARAIKDEFEPVQGAACDLAVKAKSPAFGPPAMDVLKATYNHWVLRATFQAAGECGIGNDRRLEVCVGRMRPLTNDMNMLLLSLLIDGSIKHQGGYGSQSIDDWTSILPGIQKAWVDFIVANRQALREGKRFRIAQPPVTVEMFPPGFSFHRVGEPDWPQHTPPPIPTKTSDTN